MSLQEAGYAVPPRASRLANSMRDIGYDFHTALADLVDNAITAGATCVAVSIHYEGHDSYVLVVDNGRGMNELELVEALRFGSCSSYRVGDLGRFGLGLKTGSLSQCRRLSIVTRSRDRGPLSARALDLDLIDESDSWLLTDVDSTSAVTAAQRALKGGTGTAVIWEKLDRVLPVSMAANGWGRRRMHQLVEKSRQLLAMTFHRFLSGNEQALRLTINGETVEPWDPFATHEPSTIRLPPVEIEVQVDGGARSVRLERFVLPPRSSFSSPEEHERLGGPLKWNRQQGIYVYRSGRLVQGGGWCGIRALDEHTKLARAALHFETDLDELFRINIAKMRVQLPSAVRQMLDRPVSELCFHANDVYRRHDEADQRERGGGSSVDLSDVGIALKAAALEAGQLAAIHEVAKVLQVRSPDLSRALRLD